MTETRNKLLTVNQFAEALGVTPACIRRWLLERKIAHVKVGRLVRLTPDELSRVVQDGFRPAKPQRTR